MVSAVAKTGPKRRDIVFFSSRRRHTSCSRDWSSDVCFFYPSRRRHTRCSRDWSSDVCSSDLRRRPSPSSGTRSGPRPAGPGGPDPRRRAAMWACAWSLFLLVLVLVALVLGHLPGPANLDVAVERLDLEAGASGTDREAEPVLGLAGQLDGEAGVEIAVERRHRDRHVRLLRHRNAQVTVVGREAVAARVLDRAVVRDIAVDRIGLGVRGLDLQQRDVPVHGLRGDVAGDLGRLDLLVHGVEIDTALRLLECHRSLDRLEDRKSTRLNSSHGYISYAVFCLKKKKEIQITYWLLGREVTYSFSHST